jgi:ABC-type branched-subunit amino acid transport system substrate-binding protein
MERTYHRRLTPILGAVALGLVAACGSSSSSSSTSGGGGGSGKALLLSGDGTVDPQYYKDAGSAGDGSAFASSAPDATNLPSAAKFNSDYKAAYSSDPVAYSAYGYDSMNILLDAVKNVIVANGGKLLSDPSAFRAAVVAQVGKEDWTGAIGETKFDQLGDTLNKAFTVYQASGGKWTGLETVTAGDNGNVTNSGTGSASSSSSSSAGSLSSCSGTVTVASDLPTSGGDASIGGGTEKGVKLAVTQANAAKLLGGCTISYIAKDDASAAKGKHDPQQGAQNVQGLVANQAVVGIVGPFNSGVAVAELPITNAAGVVQISPSNTDPGLTIAGSDPDIDTKSLQPSGKVTYYRIISNDVVQAQIMANFAYKEKNLRKVYDIDDQETYGKDLSNYFDKDFQQLGGTITKRTGLPGDTKDFRGALNEAKGLGSDAVFFGGVAANGSGLIKAQMKDVGLA